MDEGMTGDEHRAAAMLLGGDACRVSGRLCARIYVRDGNYIGTAIYNYVDIKTLESVLDKRSEVKQAWTNV